MLPPLTALELKVGDSETLQLLVSEDDGSPIDLSSFTAEFSVNKGRKGGIGSFTYLSTDDDPVVSVESGSPLDYVELRITPEMTRDWTGGKGTTLQYEVTITDPSGVRRSILDGELVMRGEVRFEP